MSELRRRTYVWDWRRNEYKWVSGEPNKNSVVCEHIYNWFEINPDVEAFDLVVSLKPHPEAYELRYSIGPQTKYSRVHYINKKGLLVLTPIFEGLHTLVWEILEGSLKSLYLRCEV